MVQHANSGVRIVQAANPTGPKAVVICSGLAGRRANARLIAAAPDLLAALKEIEAFTNDVPDDHPLSHVCGTARAAIAKAEARAALASEQPGE